ncbi:hypothetical protein [Mycobacteroides abscessus]|uniref:hypothetical protein n=1 Tax=Mycobacteroides abscessus TaxID=36809 RepID=UPI0012FFE078|nr:hypothetical protein [Mycobacteroides abscessus]
MANDRVFISWSGARSREIAMIWKSLIEDTFDSVDAFVSHGDISPGERGLAAIKEQLDGTSVGIPVVTRDNVGAAWINFESGALSKEVPDATVRVMPCLVDYEDASELTGPLTQFQAKLLNRDGVEAILATIAEANSVGWARKKSGFDARWPQFDQRFDVHRKSKAGATSAENKRSDNDMLAEIVNNTRELRKVLESGSYSPRLVDERDPRQRNAEEVLADVGSALRLYSLKHSGELMADAVMDTHFRIWVLVSEWTAESWGFLTSLGEKYDVRTVQIQTLRNPTAKSRRGPGAGPSDQGARLEASAKGPRAKLGN